MIIKTSDITNENVIVQVGVDKVGEPVYVGDTIIEEMEQWFSPDYWNGYNDKGIRVAPSEKKLHKGKTYRKVIFNGSSFVLERFKVEGSVPMSQSAEIWAIQNNLDRYTKIINLEIEKPL